MYMRFLAILFLSSVGLIHPMDPSKTDYFSLIPEKALKEDILAHALVNYGHPIEFTNLKTVSKECYKTIKNPDFKEKCKQKGFHDPALVLIPSENKKKGNNVQFTYIDPFDPRLTIDSRKKGFRINDTLHDGFWVNPNNVDVHNGAHLELDHTDINKFYKSKIRLSNHIKRNRVEESYNPIGFLEWPLKHGPVTKWPSSYNFPEYDHYKKAHEALALAKMYDSDFDMSDDEASPMSSARYDNRSESKEGCKLM